MEVFTSLHRSIMGLKIYTILQQAYETDDVCPDYSYVPFYISLDKEKVYNRFLEEKKREHKNIFRPRDEFELDEDNENEYSFYLGNWHYSLILKEYPLDEEI